MSDTTAVKKDLFVGVNEPADPSNLTDLEKKHLPIIDAPDSFKPGECFNVEIEVGKLLAHPNEHGHFIQFIDLYADQTFLARADLTAITSCPKVRFCISIQQPINELRAYDNCNLHGTWVSRKKICTQE